MNLDPGEAILVTGSADEVGAFLDDRIVIIDWKTEVEDVVHGFQLFLPENFLTAEWPDLDRAILHVGGRAQTVTFEPRYPGIPLADIIRRLLLPDYEAPCLRDSLGADTACYYVRPAAWWRELRTVHPERFALLFTDADHS